MNLSQIRELAFGGLEATLREVRMPSGLILTETRLDFGPTKLETAPPSLALSRPGRFESRISAESLKAYLDEAQPGGARDFEVRMEEGCLRLAATARLLFDVRVEVTCALRIENRKRICVSAESASVMGLSSGGLVQKQIEAANPLLDVSDWPVEVSLASVEIVRNAVVVRGEIHGLR